MAKRRLYGRPPIIEALCQFRFLANQEWDNTVPGLLFARVRSEFPKRRKHAAFEFNLEPGATEVKKISTDRTQFVRSDGSGLVQVGPDLLIVNVLRPYPRWGNFRATILKVLKDYWDIAEPAGIESMALRYINRVVLPIAAPTIDVENYTYFSPVIPNGLPQDYTDWTQSVAIPVGGGSLRLTSGSSWERDEFAVLLDLEFSTMEPASLKLNQLPDTLDAAHEHIETAFEECMSDKARALFEEETSHEQTSVG